MPERVRYRHGLAEPKRLPRLGFVRYETRTILALNVGRYAYCTAWLHDPVARNPIPTKP